MRRRRGRLWLARLAAPAALLAAATVAVLLVREGLHADDEPEPPAAVRPTTTVRPTTRTRTAPTTTRARPAARYHVIEPGDTLLVISERFDTTVPELLRLNPGIDPTNLVVGRRIRVA